MATALFTRWFQLQVFTPGFQMHLSNDPAAPWCSPDPAQRLLVGIIRLRRRLTPYAISTGADQNLSPRQTRARSASRRSADFTRDTVSLGPHAFGPSLRIIPAPPASVDALPAALPEGGGWIDFWTGAAYSGGQTVRVAAPLERAPILVRTGTILPLATVDDRTGQAAYPLEIRIYPGADGAFKLLEPIDGGPEARFRLAFEWNDRARTLRVVPDPTGRPSAPRKLKIVVVHPGRGTGPECPQRPDIEVDCVAEPLLLTLPSPSARPNPPQRLVASLQGDKMHFGWQEPCSGALYRLKRVVHHGGIAEDVASSLGEPRCALPLSSLNLPASFLVTATNSGGESPPSTIIRVEAPAPAAGRAAAGAKSALTVAAFMTRRALSPVTEATTAPARARGPAEAGLGRASDLAA